MFSTYSPHIFVPETSESFTKLSIHSYLIAYTETLIMLIRAIFVLEFWSRLSIELFNIKMFSEGLWFGKNRQFSVVNTVKTTTLWCKQLINILLHGYIIMNLQALWCVIYMKHYFLQTWYGVDVGGGFVELWPRGMEYITPCIIQI